MTKNYRNELITNLLDHGIFVKKYTLNAKFNYVSLQIDFKNGLLRYDGMKNEKNFGEINLKYLCKIQKGTKTEIFLNSKIDAAFIDNCFSSIFANN